MPTTAPWPLMPPRSTEARLAHFDSDVYNIDPGSFLYRYVDALAGDVGAGSLKKQSFIARLSGALESIYFSDLDYIFGNIHFLSRTTDESYEYDPSSDMLTADQWDEVAVKDAWYRARIKEYFKACHRGSTASGIRHAVHAAISVDCDVIESYRYLDRPLWDADFLGRSDSRAEVTIRPHQDSLSPKEFRLLREMIDKFVAKDTVVTISTNGLEVASPMTDMVIAADSSYFEVQKRVTPPPILADIPPPEILAIDLLPSEQWALKGEGPEVAPYAAFNISQESSFYYLLSGGARSPIDSVEYTTLQEDGSLAAEAPLVQVTGATEYTEWRNYDVADSPDNYPGGKFGLHPSAPPALSPDNTPYVFPWASQDAYVIKERDRILRLGGVADKTKYKLPLETNRTTRVVYVPELAVAYSAPTKESTVTSTWTGRRPRTRAFEVRATSILFGD